MEAAADLSSQPSSLEHHPEPRVPLADGQVLLGRYMLMRQIGQGGTSTVYRVRDLLAVIGGDVDESHIAAKIVQAPANKNLEHNQQMMLREALTTRHLSHPNILKVYDYHQDGDINFVTMELIEGESLADLLKRKPGGKLPYSQIKKIVSEVSKGLAAAHSAGVIHSDIKPSNILVSETGAIKVIDFATARSYIDARVKGLQVDDGANFYGFTLAYASPQTIADEPATPSDDVFSLACIIYEMLTGKHPYARKPTSTIAPDHVPPKPKTLSFVQWRVLKRGLSLKSDKRHDSIQNFTHSFFQAKNIPLFTLSAIAMSGILYWAVGALMGSISEYQDRQALLTSVFEKDERLHSIIEPLSGKEILPPYELENGVVGLNSDQREAFLLAAKAPVINGLALEVEALLAKPAGQLTSEMFDLVTTSVTRVMEFYPDSHTLHAMRDQLEHERQLVVQSLTRQYYSLWQFEPFTASTAENILFNRDKIISFDPLFEPEVGADTLARFKRELDTSIIDRDISALVKLSQFRSLVESPMLDDSLGQSILALDYSVQVQGYLSKNLLRTDGFEREAYPLEAVRYFIQADISLLSDRLPDLWFDKDMLVVSSELIQLQKEFLIPNNSELVAELRGSLIEKIEGKIQFHSRKGFKESKLEMETLLEKMQSFSLVENRESH